MKKLFKRMEAARLLRLETVREACKAIGISHGTWANIRAGIEVSGLVKAKVERYISLTKGRRRS